MNSKIHQILSQFGIQAPAEPYGNGHINQTYLVHSTPRYILQRINKGVFTEPQKVMENIVAVTEHLQKKLLAEGGDPTRETLSLLPTANGQKWYTDAEGNIWRVYLFIEDSLALDRAEDAKTFATSAHAFGRFQKMLADFPAEKLYEVIPKFHNTANRLLQFKEALQNDKAGRAGSVKPEIDFVLSHAHLVNTVIDALADGSVPLRVTHNDTKLNNVLLDAKTMDAVCVIDLDTVMPGSLLYDFGDSLRFGASTGAEDEIDLSKIEFDLAYFKAFTHAYLEELGDAMTARERELLPFSALLLTLECGMRFLADYLNGDTYFRTHREHHNLDRARTQFKLVADMEEKMDEMKKIVAEC